jgi:alpha-tubulin suppressor-like RCC1 family protein
MRPIMRLTHAGVAVAILALACSDAQEPLVEKPLPPSPFVVSSPVPGRAAAQTGVTLASSGASTVVYVSLPPGAIPDGRAATIRDTHLGSVASTMMANGGFDPVSVVANVDDTLAITVQVDGLGAPLSYIVAVPKAAPPVVVRTSPPPHKRDVPLNASIVIVFSHPMDPATVDTASVRLWRGTTPVAGTVRFADTLHIRVSFLPNSLLDRETDYQLVVSSSILDLNGLGLDSTVTVLFTTGSSTPPPPPTNLVFTSVNAGYLHACGVTTAGTAVCWGSGALGKDSIVDLSLTPVLVGGGMGFAAVTAGDFHSCGRSPGGVAYCWGDGSDGGQLGDGTTSYQATPVPVVGGLTFASMTAGGFHTCGLTPAGDAYCWGANVSGQLGDGTTTSSSRPVRVAGGLRFTAMSAGVFHTCGLTVQGAAYCWGANGDPGGAGDGRLGDGTTTDRSSPTLVAGSLSFVAVSAGYYHTCGLTAAGNAYCWGKNAGRDLGGGISADTASPMPVAGGLSFASVSAGGQHTCGVTGAGDAYCWPAGHPPQPVAGGVRFATVSAGFEYDCGVTAAGTAYCWGRNWAGQLGNGDETLSDSYNSPVKVAGQP